MQPDPSTALLKMTGSLQMIEQPEVMFGSFTPLIQSFFARMTADQWQLLKSGTPDETTTSLLAELLMNIVTSVSNGFLAAFQDLNVMISTEDIQTRLGDTLSNSFAEVLGVQGTTTVSLEASERLKDLVVKEVSETVNSILKEPSINQRITPPRRLKAMLRYTLTMLKRLMRNVCIPRVKERRRRISPPEKVKKRREKVAEEELLQVPTEAPQTSGTSELLEERIPLDDSFVTATTKAALDIIRREVGNITEPLLEDVGDADYEVLQASVSQEIESVADDVAQLIAEETKVLGEVTMQPKPKPEAFLMASQKIKAFFAKCRAKAWILCMVAPYKKKSQQSKMENTESLQLLLDIIDSLFVSEEDVEVAGKQLCIFPRLKDVSQGRDPQFTKQLIEMIDNYINGTRVSDFAGKRRPGRTSSDMGIDNQSQSLVLIFLSVMKWWLETQADQHVDRVTLELTGAESFGLDGRMTVQTEESFAMTVSAPTVSVTARAAAQLERKKIAVKILVEHVVSHIINKAKVTWAVDHRVIMERLFEKSWAGVENTDFPISGETFVDFDKMIFKTLRKKWGNAKVMLLALTSQETAIEEYITTAIKNRLIPRSKQNILLRFFSWLGKAFRR